MPATKLKLETTSLEKLEAAARHRASRQTGVQTLKIEHVLDKSHQDVTAYEQVTLDDEDVGVSDNEETPYS